MKFQIQISDKAEADVDVVLAWFQDQSATEAGSRWLVSIWRAIGTLEIDPGRCSLAEESAPAGFEIRELLVGRRRGTYRILFQIRGKTVHIMRIWHSARDAVNPEDL